MFKLGDLIKVNLSSSYRPNWLQGKRGIIIAIVEYPRHKEAKCYRIMVDRERWLLGEEHLQRIDERF